MTTPFVDSVQELAEVLGQQPALLFLGGPAADVAWALNRHNASISRAPRFSCFLMSILFFL